MRTKKSYQYIFTITLFITKLWDVTSLLIKLLQTHNNEVKECTLAIIVS